MSAIIQPIISSVLADQVFLIAPEDRKRNYACRIGFIGAEVDRFDQGLLGKVLDSRNFGTLIPELGADKKATMLAKRILGRQICAHYPVVRQRLIFAGLTGGDKQNRESQLEQALDWLKSRNVDAIYFQYQWMVPSHERLERRSKADHLMVDCLTS